MFLDWIEKLNFLEHNPETSVFLKFPTTTRKVIAFEVCRVLLDEKIAAHELDNCAHLRVILECVGQSFGLPMEAAVIIDHAVQLYRKWLTDEDAQPHALKADEQAFYKDMFKHMSLLFYAGTSREESRSAKQGEKDIQSHTKLCLDVLDIFQQSSRVMGHRFTSDTWETVLKIILGCCDFLLATPEDTLPIAKLLASRLLEVLFELWLRSRNADDIMWAHLKGLVMNWRHRLPTVHQWSATTLALTQNVVHLLYGPPVGTSSVQIILTSSGSGTTIKGLSSDYVYYAWYRTLHLLGDLESIPDSINYFEAQKGVSSLTRCLLSVDEGLHAKLPDATSSCLAPDGNTILRILGPWLLDAINSEVTGYENGKAAALESLCRIFSSRPNTQFSKSFLACFYRGVHNALVTGTNLLLSVVLRNATSLFQCEFEGLQMLIPAFIHGLERVLLAGAVELEGTNTTSVILRRACIKIIGCLICLPHHFKGVKFASLSTPHSHASLPPVITFADMAPHISEILLAGLHTENDDENRQMWMWTTCMYIFEVVAENALYAHVFITKLLKEIRSITWSVPVAQTALVILSELSALHPLLGEDEHDCSTAIKVVNTLCQFIDKQMLSTNKNVLEVLCVEALICLQKWLVVGQWLPYFPDIQEMVLSVLDVSVTGKFDPDRRAQTYHMPTNSIHQAGDLLFLALFQHFGNFPTQVGPSSLSSLVSEHSLTTREQLPPQAVQCFLFNRTLLSTIQHHTSGDENPELKVTAIARNNGGRFAWEATLKYFPHQLADAEELSSPVEPEDIPIPYTNPNSKLNINKLGSEEFVKSLTAFWTDADKRLHETVLLQAKIVAQSTQKRVQEIHGGDSAASFVCHQPTRDLLPAQDPTSARLFLTHLGFLSLGNRGVFSELGLNQSGTPPEALLKLLDDQCQRQCASASIFFIPHGATDHEILSYSGPGPKAYQHFVENVGWPVKLSTHKGFSGNLRQCSMITPYAPYVATLNEEVIFQVASHVASGSSEESEVKRQLLASSPISVLWCADAAAPIPGFLKSCPLLIRISPLPSQLYRVRITFQQSATKNFVGPILDDMVLSRHLLSYAVQRTTVNAIVAHGDVVTKPTSLRTALIDDAAEQSDVFQSFPHFVTHRFVGTADSLGSSDPDRIASSSEGAN
mmetsp:Transcript_2068/g.4811  ORF Transcript_2068/g.4811 Transcript_2068/m.4811 type:complete len:1158 (-) Transcript_2068:823-4296(-)